MAFAWHTDAMTAVIDKAGRLVIPAAIREKLGLKPGTQLDLIVEDGSVRLARRVPGPKLVKQGGRLVARPTVPLRSLPEIDIAALVEEERNR
jgi:AbrB family looped-hinge helix DNA binding protein